MLWYVVSYFILSFVLIIIHRSGPDASNLGWHENDRGVSFKFGADVVDKVCEEDFELNSIFVF